MAVPFTITSNGTARRQLQLAYVFESLVHRVVESNDGVRVVERRRFVKVWIARLLTKAENLKLDLGPPEKEVLQGYPATTEIGTRAIDSDRLAESILEGGAEAVGRHAANLAYLQVDSLSGKTVRIVYEDGAGVVSVEPVGCTLSHADREFLRHTPVLSDAYFTTRRPREAERMEVPASQFAWLFDPSLRQVPRGKVHLGTILPRVSKESTEIPFAYNCFDQNSRGSQADGVVCYDATSGLIRSAVVEGPLRSILEPGTSSEVRLSDMAFSPLETDMICSFSRNEFSPYRWDTRDYPADAKSPRIRKARSGWQAASPVGTFCCMPATVVNPDAGPVTAADKSPNRAGWFVGDLGAARLVLMLAATGCFWYGSRLARHGRAWITATAATGAAAVILGLALWLHGRLWLANLVPLSSCIVLTNWLPLGGAFLIGLLTEYRAIPLWRRTVLVAILAVAGGSTLEAGFPDAELPPSRLWSVDGICLQTSPASCSACAAATLLAHHGIPADEQEMSRLCLSKKEGTPILGLYRGLKLKTQGTRWGVAILDGPFEELRNARRFPIVLSVRVGDTAAINADSDLREPSILPGVLHAVVLFGFTSDGDAEIRDPSRNVTGRTFWSEETLKSAYGGNGVYLLDRYTSRSGPQ